jgi:hypothetical protein
VRAGAKIIELSARKPARARASMDAQENAAALLTAARRRV